MIIPRAEPWGTLKYDTEAHRFSYTESRPIGTTPYAPKPVVLNVDLTMECNLHCRHCVARDFGRVGDLVISPRLLNWINSSPFMVVVVTGGEPLLPGHEENLIRLLRGVRRKGLVVDTNGTIVPSGKLMDIMVERQVLVRVSWDTPRMKTEVEYRRINGTARQNRRAFSDKIDVTIPKLQAAGVNVAVQSVVHQGNVHDDSFHRMPVFLRQKSIRQWYLQRVIPSTGVVRIKKFSISGEAYRDATNRLSEECGVAGIECYAKQDRRHNSVFLLVGDGDLYTQGEGPGQKIHLGSVGNLPGFFTYVSSADHAERYYGAQPNRRDDGGGACPTPAQRPPTRPGGNDGRRSIR